MKVVKKCDMLVGITKTANAYLKGIFCLLIDGER